MSSPPLPVVTYVCIFLICGPKKPAIGHVALLCCGVNAAN